MPLEHPKRRPLRLKTYDYSKPGGYYITICSEKRLPWFGNIINGTMVLSDAGLLVEKWWHRLVSKFSPIELDAFVVMPNHVHGIIFIIGENSSDPVGADPCVRPAPSMNVGEDPCVRPAPSMNVGADPCVRPCRPSLGRMLQWFKTMTTNQYIAGVKQAGWHPFPGRLWQRNYYEHVIRDEKSLDCIREYVNTNPLRWHLDRENKSALGKDDFDDWLASYNKRP
jgi:putative transposase